MASILFQSSLIILEPINSVRQTQDGNALLISTLDSTVRLLDKGNGKLLQSYKGHTNQNYRIKAMLAHADAMVISGSEDGSIYIWDILQGTILEIFQGRHGKVVSSIAWNSAPGKNEWASAGGDGMSFLLGPLEFCPHLHGRRCNMTDDTYRDCGCVGNETELHKLNIMIGINLAP